MNGEGSQISRSKKVYGMKKWFYRVKNGFVERKNKFVEQKNQGRHAELSENSKFPEYIPVWQYMVKMDC